jgi:hypothetical protein
MMHLFHIIEVFLATLGPEFGKFGVMKLFNWENYLVSFKTFFQALLA